MSTLRTLLFAIAIGVAGYATSGCGPAYVSATVTPRLVWVSPGIWVVEDYPYAVYWADGYYWRTVDGVWYRSPYYDGGFAQVHVGVVPRIVVGSYRPTHVHYRAPTHVRVRPIARDHRAPRPHRR